MVNNHEFDIRIKKELAYKASKISDSENQLQKIFSEVETRKGKINFSMNFRKYVAVFCTIIILMAATFMVSANARALALNVIHNIKTVFIMDENGQIEERPASEVFSNPSAGDATTLSDKMLSDKLGIKVNFVKSVYGDFALQSKTRLVGFNKTISYETFDKIKDIAAKAINDEKAYKSLKEYGPFRGVSGRYTDKKGITVDIGVWNTNMEISSDKNNFSEIVPTKVGNAEAKWIGVSFPDYKNGDMTQPPAGKITIHALLWRENGAMYEITSYGNLAFSMEEAMKIAEAFMAAQR